MHHLKAIDKVLLIIVIVCLVYAESSHIIPALLMWLITILLVFALMGYRIYNK